MNQQRLDNFSKACINTFPKILHEIIAIEEFSEIIKPISKLIRNPNDLSRIDELIDEIADCKIMLNTITLLYDIDKEKINTKMNDKVVRGYERIRKKKING